MTTKKKRNFLSWLFFQDPIEPKGRIEPPRPIAGAAPYVSGGLTGTYDETIYLPPDPYAPGHTMPMFPQPHAQNPEHTMPMFHQPHAQNPEHTMPMFHQPHVQNPGHSMPMFHPPEAAPVPPAPEPAARYCGGCGSKSGSEAKFCAKCGYNMG
jgi:hypothetical protein